MSLLQNLSATLLLELGKLSEPILGLTPDAARWGMLIAPLVLGAVLWLGHRRVPEGARLNGAGQVMLTAIGLAGAGLVAGFFSGWAGLQGWLWPETAHHSGALLMVLSGLTMLSGGFLRLRGDRSWMVQLTAGALLTGAGALGLKGLEVMAFSHNDYALASVVVPMNRAAMGIAGLYLLGALLVALKMPRRLAPFSAVLAVLGLVALVSGWSQAILTINHGSQAVQVFTHDGPGAGVLADAPILVDDLTFFSDRRWPVYTRFTVIDVTYAE